LKISFYKYHGAGNDFILIDNRKNTFQSDKQVIERLCNRRFGIGADGLITLEHAPGYDFGMKYFNNDGNESTMCGNGGRCVVAFADFLSLTGSSSRFLTVDGEHRGLIISKQNNSWLVRISMADVTLIKGYHDGYILNTGSPHLVRFVENVTEIDVVKEGRLVRNRNEFMPGGINVNFAEAKNGLLFVRTYERGVEDETLSCGTGVTASALAFAMISGINEGRINVDTKGGSLSVSFSRDNNGYREIHLEGPAVMAYSGIIDIDRQD
jgi:diaminopimelate epimerase